MVFQHQEYYFVMYSYFGTGEQGILIGCSGGYKRYCASRRSLSPAPAVLGSAPMYSGYGYQ